MTEKAPVDTLSFENALKELEEIVRTLESGSAPLDESISTYERGVALKKHCEKKLADAQMKIEKISVDQQGNAQAEAFQES